MFKSIYQAFMSFVLILANLSFLVSDGIMQIQSDVVVPQQSVNEYLEGRDAMTDTYAATDGLGRTVSMNEEAGDVREDRFVGLFYWTWHVSQSSSVKNVVNVNSVIENNPSASHDLTNDKWGYFGMPHHWNEPIYGYYDTNDRWVLRKQAELFAAAGVDVLIFDNTNGTLTFKNSYDVLFDVFAQAREDGVKTPQIAFLLPFSGSDDAATQLRMLYSDIYSADRYRDLWFYWEGKPLIMAYPDALRSSKEQVDKDILSFFTFRPGIAEYYVDSDQRRGETAISRAFNRDMYWSWLSVYPQVFNKTPDGKIEEMAVSVAQNYSAEKGLTAMNGENVFGRTYTSKGYDTRENAKLYGANFKEQFEFAIKADPRFIFITGWNEWVAGRFENWGGVTNAFPDEFNDTNSRDIEPSAGELKDHYYYQLADYIRRYKGVRDVEADNENLTVDTLSDWDNVTKTYYSYAGNTFDRDDIGYGNIHYTDNSGRNDIVLSKITSDSENVYFYVECADTITDKSDENWMRLLINTQNDGASWESYDYIINRSSPDGNTAFVEKSTGGWNWEPAGEASLIVNGNKMMLTVKKSVLGIADGAFVLDYKWSDNTLSTGDIMDFYKYGDTAPVGRFNYRYKSGK